MTTNKIDAKWQIFKIILFLLLTFSFSICIYFVTIVIHKATDNPITYIENWTVIDSSGKNFQTGRSYRNKRAMKEDFTIVTRLPEHIPLNQVICFQNRSNVRVYINGELRKTFDRVKDTGIPGGSLKEFYITIPIGKEDAGAELKMIRYKTDWNPVIVPETFVTTEKGVYDYMIKKYGLSFVLTIILLIASLLVIIISLVIRLCNRQHVDMLYAAIGIFIVSCWILSVSQFTPFISGLYYFDGIMGFLFCMMIPFPLLIYLNLIQKYRYNKLYMVLFSIAFCNFIFWTILHFTGILSFQAALVYIDSILGFIILSANVTCLLDVHKKHVKDYLYTITGFLIFMIMSITEIIILLIRQKDNTQMAMILGLISFLVLVVIQQIDDNMKIKASLEQAVNNKNMENQQMLIHIVKTLAGTIDTKDAYTKGHSSRVAAYAREIAKRFGYSETELNDIYMIGLLHDIGKIGVPISVINKPGALTDEEYAMIKKHPVMGAKILENIKEKEILAIGARWHHERFDGRGYPDGIKGEEIPEQARIIAVADAYDAMTSYRSYREPMAQERVREEIEKGAGTQFDPRFAAIMLEMMAEDTNYQLREKK